MLAAAAASPRLHAQHPGKRVRIGVLSTTSPETRSAWWEAFKDAMSKLGWVEGRNLDYVYRYARGDSARLDALATELVAEKPQVLVASTQAATAALKNATKEVPIVFSYAYDPVGGGLVASLARPGGNVTGLSATSVEMRAKTLELLKEIRPQLRTVAAFVPPDGATFDEIERAARPLGIKVERIAVSNLEDVDRGLRAMDSKRFDGVLFQAGGSMARQKIAERMLELKLPAVYVLASIVDAGGLLSYGADISDNNRRAAKHVDRILRGARPGDLPVEQPVTFEMVVNLKTARAQGIAIPQSILVRATRVIE